MMVLTLAARWARDRPGRDHPDPLQAPAAPVSGIGVRADLTDECLRALGQGLYRMHKARFQAATFDVRTRLAVQAHQDNLRTSLEQLPERSAALWHDPRDVAPERRHILHRFGREADGGSLAREFGQGFSPHGTCGR
jgi:hypothetical protein